MEARLLKIYKGRIVTPYRIIPRGTILITEGIITEVTAGDIEVNGATEIDARGNYIAPGFIDIHVHGGGGHDFMDGNETAFLEIAETHACFGTTSMVPTTLTSEKENLMATLAIYEEANKKNTKGAQFLGMHLEGPYFAMAQRGAQDSRYIRNPDPKEYMEVIASSKAIARWSAAPELPGAIEFAHYLKSKQILPALAHTDATYDEVIRAFENGYSLATHLYSGMSGVTRKNAFRYAGVIESAFIIDEMDVEVIADGRHLPPPLLSLIYKIKGPGKIALITDSMRAAGMPEGESVLGNLYTGTKVIVEDGIAKLPDRSSFAGSVATADKLIRNMIALAGVPLLDAIRMMTITPARIMHVDHQKGSLISGKDADIVIFTEDIIIQTTIVKGKIVYNKTL